MPELKQVERFQALMRALRERHAQGLLLSANVPDGPIDEVFLSGLPIEDAIPESSGEILRV